MPVWFVKRQFWLNPLICGERGALGASRRCVNWNLDTTSEIWWGPLSPLVFTRLASAPSRCLSCSLFSNQVRFYRPPPVSNRYRLWNFTRQNVWEPQYQLSSSRPAPLQTRGRFLKRREKLHKEHIGGRFNTNWQWKHFIQRSTSSLRFLPFRSLFSLCEPLPDCTGSLRDPFTTSRNNIWEEVSHLHESAKQIWRNVRCDSLLA